MQMLISFLLLINFSIFPDSLDSNAPEISDNTSVYCNGRFDFCIEYPSELFSDKEASSNADGILLNNANDEVSIAAYGELNVLDYTLKEQQQFLIETLSETDGRAEDYVTIFVDHSFTSTIDLPEKQIEVRCQKFADHFVTVIITLNDKTNSKYANLSKEINVKLSM